MAGPRHLRSIPMLHVTGMDVTAHFRKWADKTDKTVC